MSFVAIMKVTPENRVAKAAWFPSETAADDHVVEFVDSHPDAFVAPEPAEPVADWFIDTAAKTITIVARPPHDFGPEDQAAADRMLDDPGIVRALAQALFQTVNDVRILKGQGTITGAQFKTFLKGLIR